MRTVTLNTLATLLVCGAMQMTTSAAEPVTLKDNIARLKDDFNAAKGKVRLMLILSPG